MSDAWARWTQDRTWRYRARDGREWVITATGKSCMYRASVGTDHAPKPYRGQGRAQKACRVFASSGVWLDFSERIERSVTMGCHCGHQWAVRFMAPRSQRVMLPANMLPQFCPACHREPRWTCRTESLGQMWHTMGLLMGESDEKDTGDEPGTWQEHSAWKPDV